MQPGLIMFFSLFFALLSCVNGLVVPFEPRAAAGTITCTNQAVKLSSHDCNVALLALGPGGIAGAIKFLRPGTAAVSATSGGCTVSAASTDNSIIDISKGRLEHGGVAGFNNLLTQCGATPGTVLIQGGAQGGGNVLVTISAA